MFAVRAQSWISKAAWWGAAVLLFLAPWSGFLTTVVTVNFDFGLGDSLLKAWKEIVIVGLLGAVTGLRILGGRKFQWWQWLAIAYVGLGIGLSLLNWDRVGVKQFVWGARAEYMFVILLAALTYLWGGWRKDWQEKFLGLAFWSALGAVVMAGVLELVGYEVLVHLGYRNDWSTFYIGEAPAFCQKEGGVDFCRAQGPLVGPNRFAGFLLSALAFGGGYLKNKKQQFLWAVGVGIFLILTLSSSAWLGAIVGVGFGLVVWKRELVCRRWKWILGGLILLMVLGGGLIWSVRDALFESGSNSEHLQLMLKGLEVFIQNPLGYGLGHAGPASLKVGENLIPESWFLQVAINLGVVGLAMFLIWLGRILWMIVWQGDLKSAIGGGLLVAVAFQNVFLHTWEDVGVYGPFVFLVCYLLNGQILKGEVVKGKGAGRLLGFPTMNLKTEKELPLKYGVYRVEVDGRIGVMNFGRQPTLKGEKVVPEIHLLNGNMNYKYGDSVSFQVGEYLRGVKKFAGVEELKKQISRDCEIAKKL